MKYLILAQSEVTACALCAWLQLLEGGDVKNPSEDNHCLVITDTVRTGDQGVDAFEKISQWVSRELGDARNDHLTVLVDSVNPSSLDPLSDSGGWDNVVAMLILAFPEVRWAFGARHGIAKAAVKPNPGNESDNQVSHDGNQSGEKCFDADGWHTLPSLLSKPWRNPLHDPTGLRNWVKDRAKTAHKKNNLKIPGRIERAAAIDEEVHYALFHAYTAYRFGYRADSVTSWGLMQTLFGSDSRETLGNQSTEKRAEQAEQTGKTQSHGFHLLLEDVNLYFPDRPAHVHISTFPKFIPPKKQDQQKQQDSGQNEQGRAKHFPKLGYDAPCSETSRFRIIVTSGHSGADPEKLQNNRDYLEENKPDGNGLVLKPVAGMFDLWKKSGLFACLQEEGKHPGLAPGYVWPPPFTQPVEGISTGHSAPGKLMLIARHLIRRADGLRAEANSVEECIRGAVLATDALELLCYQTPTLALQALELKHEFEVKAEVAFLGVGHHLDLNDRFNELQREMKSAAHYFQKGRRRMVRYDVLVTIANRILLIFREAGQFEEEALCLVKVRWWNRQLSFLRTRNPFRWGAYAFLAYAEWLISSLLWLSLSILGWMAVLTIAWWVCNQTVEGAMTHVQNLIAAIDAGDFGNMTLPGWKEAIKETIGAFVAGNVSTGNKWLTAVSTIAALVGFFHLGVFVSFLYSAIARK